MSCRFIRATAVRARRLQVIKVTGRKAAIKLISILYDYRPIKVGKDKYTRTVMRNLQCYDLSRICCTACNHKISKQWSDLGTNDI